MSQSEEFYVRKCLTQIEANLNWGDSTAWSNYDFEKLSEEIRTQTSVSLSITTLKRIWGKLKYENAPTLTTLNALAQFAGYPDWRNFKQNGNSVTPEIAGFVPPKKTARLKYWVVGTLLLVAAIYFFVSAGRKTKAVPLDPAQFEFSANKMQTDGVPNSVVFHYDASKAPSDSVFIVQTWDISRKTLVPKNKHEHSAIYYYPGFFNTKLIVDRQIVKTHNLWITSNGWLCLIEDQPMPVYFRKEDYLKNDRVEISAELVKSYPHTQRATPPRIRFFNQRDFGDLSNDNFTFETTLKNDFDDGSNVCHFIQVLIQCKDDIIIIPLAAKSCIGDLSLYFCGTSAISKEADLSGFGCDLSRWTRLRVETVNKNVLIFVNDINAYSLTFPNSPTGIVGVQYRFNGSGAVKDTRFKSQGRSYEMELR